MKVSNSKALFPALLFFMAVMLVTAPTFAGENPWDGDNPSGGSINNGGGSSGSGGGCGTDPAIRSTVPEPTPGTGFSIDIYVQGRVYRFVSSVMSMFGGTVKQGTSVTTTEVQNSSGSKKSVVISKSRW